MTPSLFTQRIQAWFGVALLAEMLTTPRLWFMLPPDRPLYVPLIFPAPSWLHLLLSGLLAGCAVALLIRPRHRWAPLLASVILALLCGMDELRLQPWAWLFMLCGIMLFWARRCDGRNGDKFLAQHLRLLLVGVYFWAAAHKLNAGFFEHTMPFFLEPFGINDPGPWQRGLAGIIVIGSEMGLAVLLARAGKLDKFALRLGVGMHLGIVLILGPGGQNYDPNVWTWNLLQVALLVLLLYKGGSEQSLLSLLQQKARPTLVLAALVLAMPALHIINLAPANLSWALYAGNYDLGLIAIRKSSERPELTRAVMQRNPRIITATYQYLQSDLGEIEDLRDFAYPPQFMRELGVTYPPDGSFIRRLHNQLCLAGMEPVLILRAKHLPFARTKLLRIIRCDGSENQASMPPFLD
jgi:hypothetical protein